MHFHSLVAEGVWVDGEGGPRFVAVRRVRRVVSRLLGRAGLFDEEVEDGLKDLGRPD